MAAILSSNTMSRTNFTPSGAENSCTSASAAVPEEKHMTHADLESSLSTVMDITPDLSPKKSPVSFWSSVVNAATVVEEHLAEWFGLNQSKYQWALDEFMDQQLSGESQSTSASFEGLNEQQTRPIGQQIMQRDSIQLADV